MNTITVASTPGALTFRALLVFSGYDPEGFVVRREPGGVVVEGCGHAVVYPQDAWVARFGRDLYQGVYGRPED
jgi:hypothetical protein